MDAKICGIKDSKILNYIVNHNNPPKFIGFITNYPKSRRYVEHKNLKRLINIDKKKINFVSVLVNPNDEILEKIKDLNFDYYQLYNVSPDKTKIVGVTTLTSIDSHSLKQIGYDKKLKKLVVHQAKLANKANLDGIVCSAQEVKYVKKVFKKEIITPGIRFNSNKNDQKRIMTPKEAFKNGSDWIVIGRPITKGNIKKNIEILIDHLNK